MPDGEFYACPLCLMTYGRDAFERGVFSDEHVPPDGSGGRVLLLTCTHCNNSAGTAMDADAAAREAVHDFLSGRSLSRVLRAEYNIGEVTVQGNVTSENGAVIMNVVPKANNPKNVTAITETLTGAPSLYPSHLLVHWVRGFGCTPGPRRAIAIVARPSRSTMSSARPGGPGHPDWLQGYAPMSAVQ